MSEQRVAVITGGNQGIGRAILEQLLNDGYSAVIGDLNDEKGQRVADEMNQKGFHVVSVQGDVANKASHERFVQAAIDNFGRLDTYINNAGITQIKPLVDETTDDMKKIFSINVFGTLYGIQAATAQFKKQNDGDKVRKIINASSIAGHVAFDLNGAYSATKFAVRGLTQAAAKELAQDHITVNAYCPGIVDTPMWDQVDAAMVKMYGGKKGQYLKQYASSITLGRVEKPQDVANYVSYLASSKSDYMTGQAVLIDGGIQFI